MALSIGVDGLQHMKMHALLSIDSIAKGRHVSPHTCQQPLSLLVLPVWPIVVALSRADSPLSQPEQPTERKPSANTQANTRKQNTQNRQTN